MEPLLPAQFMWSSSGHFHRMKRCGYLCGAVALLALPGRVHAEDAAAAAQVLFEQGRDLLRAGKAAAACPLLEESQRLDPANGTLLALAMCHEAEGKLASAWAEFVRVAHLAKRDGQTSRETWASERAAALRPRLSMLEVRVAPEVKQLPRVSVARNGAFLHPGSWDLPVPVDGGEHRITVTAEGYLDWEHVVTIAAEGARHVVLVDQLRKDDAVVVDKDRPTPSKPPATANNQQDTPSDGGWTTLQWAGVTMAGAGIASWLGGAAVMYAALNTYAEGDRCTGPCRLGKQHDARRLGNWATGLGIGGAALVLAGGGLLLWGGDSSETRATGLGLDVHQTGAHLAVRGSF